MQRIHHGGFRGVTGSCHQLRFDSGRSLLVDCGLFQGADARFHPSLHIDFPLDGVEALVLTHAHIDHVGRLPYLLAAGFDGPVFSLGRTQELLYELNAILGRLEREKASSTGAVGGPSLRERSARESLRQALRRRGVKAR